MRAAVPITQVSYAPQCVRKVRWGEGDTLRFTPIPGEARELMATELLAAAGRIATTSGKPQRSAILAFARLTGPLLKEAPNIVAEQWMRPDEELEPGAPNIEEPEWEPARLYRALGIEARAIQASTHVKIADLPRAKSAFRMLKVLHPWAESDLTALGSTRDPAKKKALIPELKALVAWTEQLQFPWATTRARRHSVITEMKQYGLSPLGPISLTARQPIPCSVRLTATGLTLVATTALGAMALGMLLLWWRAPRERLTTCVECEQPMLESPLHRRYCSMRCKWRAKKRRYRKSHGVAEHVGGM